MKNFCMLLLSIFFFSCQQKEIKKNPVPVSDSVSVIEKENIEKNKQIGDTIVLNFKNEKGLYVAEGSLDSIHPRVYLKFKNEDSGEINAKILPSTGKGNIRFNQVIFPDQSSDGPFGMDLKINLTQKGNHILVIGHSQMADNPFWGKFNVELEQKKQ
ncbi:hypothetical protein ACHRV6_10525 [Flavobacterium sp. FlaQc-51]|uniref:hypothetical protein n=1 Tax=Flavobacterium sp. FlaQc-51 TaxID=3374184 RepID=UPI003756E8DD